MEERMTQSGSIDLPVTYQMLREGLCVSALISVLLNDSKNVLVWLSEVLSGKSQNHHKYLMSKCSLFTGPFESQKICAALCLCENSIPEDDQKTIVKYISNKILKNQKLTSCYYIQETEQDEGDGKEEEEEEEEVSMESSTLLSAIWLIKHIKIGMRLEKWCDIIGMTKDSVAYDLEMDDMKEKGIDAYLSLQSNEKLDELIAWANTQRRLCMQTQTHKIDSDIEMTEIKSNEFYEGLLLEKILLNRKKKYVK